MSYYWKANCCVLSKIHKNNKAQISEIIYSFSYYVSEDRNLTVTIHQLVQFETKTSTWWVINLAQKVTLPKAKPVVFHSFALHGIFSGTLESLPPLPVPCQHDGWIQYSLRLPLADSSASWLQSAGPPGSLILPPQSEAESALDRQTGLERLVS